jgi:foldase protein PrsA
MRTTLARSSALGAFFVAAALTLGACGGSDSVPSDSVAKVDETPITKATFNHWMTVAAKGQAAASGAKSTSDIAAPVPPDYTVCVAQLRKATKPVKGQPTPTTASLKEQCKAQYESYRDQVLQLLISSVWYAGEGKDQGLTVSDKTLDAEFEKRKKQSFSTDKQYKQYLKASGYTPADLKLQVRADLFGTKLRDKIVKSTGEVTDKQIHSYYVKNKKNYAQEERRDIRIVLTKTRAQALAAKKALESDRSWKSVAKQYSTDQGTKNIGGVLLGVTKGSQEKALGDAVFGAEKNRVIGPVKTQFGYYVVEVDKVSPATQQSEAQAKAAITTALKQERQDKALNTFVEAFQKKWKAKTLCASAYKSLQLCKNAPKQKTTDTTTGATTPG